MYSFIESLRATATVFFKGAMRAAITNLAYTWSQIDRDLLLIVTIKKYWRAFWGYTYIDDLD